MLAVQFNFSCDYLVTKLDVSGNVIWCRHYYTLYNDQIYDYPKIGQLPNGNFFITTNQLSRMGLICADANGNMLWTKTFRNDSTKNPGFASAVCNDGGIITTGKRQNDVQLVKTDTHGAVQWSKIFEYNGMNYSHANDIVKTPDGNFVVAGYELDQNNFIYNVGFLMKVDNSGNILWQKDYASAFSFEKVLALPSGELITLGADAFSPGLNFIKTDMNGNFISGEVISNSSLYAGDPFALKLNGNHIIASLSGYNSIFATDPNLNFACSAGYTVTPTVAVPPANIITGQISVSSSGFAQGPVILTASAFTPQISDYCTLFSVNEVNNSSSVTVYPNPFTTSATIKIDAPQTLANAYAQLYDMLGNKVSEVKLQNNQARLQRGNLPSGIYFYKVISENTVLGQGKVAVE